MGLDGQVPGAAMLRLVPGVTLLRADEQVFGAMLDGWADQQLARNLAPATAGAPGDKGFSAGGAGSAGAASRRSPPSSRRRGSASPRL